jgi:hypothetical protein
MNSSLNQTLTDMAGIIGTTNSKVSRIVCAIAAIVCWMFVLVFFMYRIGKND